MAETTTDASTESTYAFEPAASPSSAALSDPDAVGVKRHYGKFRGTVIDNTDPYGQGRLLVSVPGIVLSNWAMPCVPVTDLMMGTYVRPRIGANVWVEFERGDPNQPIWVGCWWGEQLEVPPMASAATAVPPTNTVITLETATSGISICDVPIEYPIPGSVLIQSGAGTTSIALTPAGIVITAPTVTINTDQFTVTAPNFTVS
ncbi:MAG TPA: phage baseplate assembly protein V [Solirubrobacteraceae bacterium]|nr:phage baseplate assembly protein V [Solirubrobacteraceae bacterium]